MKVKMKVHTGWNKKKVCPGDVLEVAAILAKRWIARGIAEKVVIKKAKSAKNKTRKYDNSRGD